MDAKLYSPMELEPQRERLVGRFVIACAELEREFVNAFAQYNMHSKRSAHEKDSKEGYINTETDEFRKLNPKTSKQHEKWRDATIKHIDNNSGDASLVSAVNNIYDAAVRIFDVRRKIVHGYMGGDNQKNWEGIQTMHWDGTAGSTKRPGFTTFAFDEIEVCIAEMRAIKDDVAKMTITVSINEIRANVNELKVPPFGSW